MHRVMMIAASFVMALVFLFALVPFTALAQGKPARTETVAAGPYIIDIELSQDPPFTDQPFEVTIVPHNASLRLNSGQIVAQPGLGTDAIPLHADLTAAGNSQAMLTGKISLPVKGAWNIIVKLNGSQGPGEASISTVVGSPGAMPGWLAWLIGCTPLIGIALCVLYQHRYRRLLVAKQAA